MSLYAPPKDLQTRVFVDVVAALGLKPRGSPWSERSGGPPIHSFLEGPSFDCDGNLYCVNAPFGQILKITPERQVSVACTYDGIPNGLKIHKDGEIFIADRVNGLMRLDPISGRILGAIDITGGPRVAVPEVLQLVRATVAAAEAELRLHLMSAPHLLSGSMPRLETFGSGRPMLHRDGQRIPLSQRHAEILLLLADHPEGLGADRLAVLLDEAELDSVTIRAEMSRLRKTFGSDRVGSRPYRLLGDLVTDVADVRAALDRGDAATAVRLYTGPVLPGSAAPGIEEIRDELRTRVQAALLRGGDAHLLAQWTSSVHGRDDLTAWSAYLTALDPGSAMYAQVRARIDLLDRQLAT